MASENVITVTDSNFDELVTNSATPVLLDFWAPWCGPCNMMAPALDEIADQYKGKLIVAKMNVDENPATPAKFGVRGIPNLQFFKGGQRVADAEIVGAVPKPKLEETIAKVL
jgi:thioredoxin 1